MREAVRKRTKGEAPRENPLWLHKESHTHLFLEHSVIIWEPTHNLLANFFYSQETMHSVYDFASPLPSQFPRQKQTGQSLGDALLCSLKQEEGKKRDKGINVSTARISCKSQTLQRDEQLKAAALERADKGWSHRSHGVPRLGTGKEGG